MDKDTHESCSESSPAPLGPLDWLWVVWTLLITLSAFGDWVFPLRILTFALLGITLWQRSWVHAATVFAFFLLFWNPIWVPSFYWQVPTLPYLFPVSIVLLLGFFPNWKHGLSGFRLGTMDVTAWALSAVTCVGAAAALLLWAIWTDNLGAGARMVEDLKGIPPWFLFLFGIPIFAVVNAFAEEAAYRCLLQESLERRFPERPALVLGLQASAFAAAHFHAGFPNGKVGYLMTFIYALMLGYLKLRTRGVKASFLTHVAADLVIGYTLVLLSLSKGG